jgi:signal transduction histidine kinase
MFPRLSLRTRITAWSAAMSFLGCALAAGVVSYVPYREELARRDAAADSRGRKALERIAAKPGPLDAPSDVFADLPGFVVFASGPADGEPVVWPGTFREHLPSWPPVSGFYGQKDGVLAGTRFAVFQNASGVVMAGYDVSETEAAFRNRLGFLYLAPIFGLLGGLGGWILAGRALRPVSRLAEAAARISAGNLAERLPDAGGDELARLASVLNRMLDRLESAFSQSSRFSADASHELRTPLCVMRATIEEELRCGTWNEKQERTLLDLLEEIVALTGISDNLLMLARFDAGAQTFKAESVDLSVLVDGIAEDAALLAESRDITITPSIEENVRVAGDRALLRRLFMNLADNAVRHNRDGGRVDITLQKSGDAVLLLFRNTGPGIPPEDAARLFTRFFRATDDRARESGGSGLGLSLCHEIVRAHGGTIRLAGSDAEATTFVVEFPSA